MPLPESIRNSDILTGNDLGHLANVREMPIIEPSFDDTHLKNIIQYYSLNPDDMEKELHAYAKKLLAEGKSEGSVARSCWRVLNLFSNQVFPIKSSFLILIRPAFRRSQNIISP
jgi:hypothetical protein